MEKTLITKVAFYIAFQLLKIVANRTDNKLDDKWVKGIEEAFYSK